MKSFQTISEQQYHLINVFQCDDEVIYNHYCPIAFKNDGTKWMSNSLIIKNPYWSFNLLNRSELLDSIDFKPKNSTN